MAGDRLIAAIVPHTHWDRAWYHPFEMFRLSLCRVFQRLMDILESDARYRCFTFDGQSVVLEDYLELYPQDRPRIERLVRSRRLTFGPSYVLPDMFLITGESHVRNGLIGRRLAESFGRSSAQGYVADPFGLISQLPQIYAGLGIESVFFSRGLHKADVAKAGNAFWWRGPDGRTRILGYAQVSGYGNLCLWGVPLGTYPREDPDTDQIDFAYSEKQVRDQLEAYRRAGMKTRVLFFGNGVDHQGPQHHLGDLVEHNAAAFPDVAFTVVDTDELVAMVRRDRPRLASIDGEMHGTGLWPTLNGTLESRFYLKQQYDRAAGWLERRAEPLCAIADRLGLPQRVLRPQHQPAFAFNHGNNVAMGPTYPAAPLLYAWKLLLRNAPHDDICGCSIDPTHADAENRAKRVVEIAGTLGQDAALRIAANVAPPTGQAVAQVVAFNTLGRRRTCPIRIDATVPAQGTDLVITDATGRVLPADIRAEVRSPAFRRWHSEAFENLQGKEVHADIRFTTNLPAMGYAAFFLREGRSSPAAKSVRRLVSGMENEWIRVRVSPHGTIDLLDKRTGHRFSGLNRLRDTGEAGDLYVSRLLEDSREIESGSLQCVEETFERVTWRAHIRTGNIPTDISRDFKSRAGRGRPIEIELDFTLYACSPAVHVTARWVNAHGWHRLMAEFPTGLRTASTQAQSTWDVVRHDAPFTQASCRDFVTAADSEARLTILSRSMHSCDARLERGRLILGKCLLRATGRVNMDLELFWQAPEGNCLRPVVQEYAILPGQPQDPWADLAAAAEEFVHRPLVDHYQCGQGDMPAELSFIRVEGPFELTTMKRCEDRPGLIVRLVNWSDRKAALRLWIDPRCKVKKAFEADLRERRLRPLTIRAGCVSVQSSRRQIVTLELV